jgi:hypothetical protein
MAAGLCLNVRAAVLDKALSSLAPAPGAYNLTIDADSRRKSSPLFSFSQVGPDLAAGAHVLCVCVTGLHVRRAVEMMTH